MLTPEEQVSGPLQQLPTPSRRTLSRMLLLLGRCSLLLLLLLLPLRLLRTVQRAGMGGKIVLDPTTVSHRQVLSLLALLVHAGTQFTCFASTNVQILTPEEGQRAGYTRRPDVNSSAAAKQWWPGLEQ